MPFSHTFNSKGFYIASIEDYGFPPHNSTRVPPPPPAENLWPQWDGSTWNNVPNFKDQSGYLNGQPFTIKDYGPLPDGFTWEPPAPTTEELFQSLRASRNQLLAQSDHLLLPDSPLTPDQSTALKLYRQALRDLPAQQDAPWDGGGPQTPWPQWE